MKDLLCGLVTGPGYNVVNNGNNQTSNRIRKRSATIINNLMRERVPHISTDRRRPSCSFVLLLLGLLAIAAGCFILVLQPYDIIFKWKLIFGDGGEVFELWRKPPIDLYLKVRLFNVTNADQFLAGLEPMKVQETGPYVYREYLEHSNVTFNDNGTLSMVPKHPLVWVPELSNGTEQDMLILPNIALLSAAQIARDQSFFARLGLNVLIRKTDTQPLVRMTAREFMFGYKSTLMTLGNTFLRSWVPFDSLGLIDRMYSFDGDFSTVSTGENDVRTSGLIDTYNGSPDLPQWEGEHCSKVSGASDATKFLSFIEPQDKLRFFRKSVCRVMPLVYNGSTTVDGLDAWNYVFEDNSLDNGEINPENKCFCRNDRCLPSGLIDVTDCYYGFPIAVSFPHFLQGDPALVEAVEGSHPDPEKHSTFFKIGPDSGLPLEVAVRFQINMALDDISSISHVERFSNMVLPMLWIEISMDKLPSDLRDHFYLLLNILPTIQTAGIYLLFSTGCCLLVYSIARSLILKVSKQRRRPEPISERLRRPNELAEHDMTNSKEMEVYYCSLLANARESDIV